MSGNDHEPIGRRRKQHNVSEKSLKGARKESTPHRNQDGAGNEEIELVLSKGKKSKNNKRSKLWLMIKLLLIFIVVVAMYGMYLDAQIRSRIDGKVWQLPAAVYGRMFNLEPDMPINKQNVIALLKGAQYREVSNITRPGEFTLHDNSIELIRRPFNFPDSKEGQIRARLSFNAGSLSEIKNLDSGRDFGFFRLDPRLITMLQSPNGEQRLFVPRSVFPTLLVNTLIVTEDRHFYQHDGVSFSSIARALIANINAGRTEQGGSTLTQQLVKNLFLNNKRTLWRKANEAYMALIMDARYSKDRILELYLNEVYLGQSGQDQIRGFPLASLYYFGRPVEELSLDQQAMLVGMVKGASMYNPWRNPRLALGRRNLVLRLLKQQEIIDQELYDMLSARSLGVQPKGGVITPQPAFMQMVRNELQQKLGDKIKDLSGVKIFTTLDPVSQDAAEKAIEEGILELRQQRDLKDLETAMVVVDRFSGEVHAMVGGAEPQYAGYNRAMRARRSIGSLAKPTTYLTALSQPDKYRLNSWIADNPIEITLSNNQTWQPRNDNHQFSGRVMLVDALARSINVPTVNLGMTLGLQQVIDTWGRLGIAKDQLYPRPSMLLGALNLTPVEAAQAFQTIASGGNHAQLSALRSVIAEDGTVLYQSFPQAEPVEPAQATYLTLYTMQQVAKRGTARALGASYPNANLAVKTGTTNNLVDSWFAGIDGKEVAIIWVGRDNNQSSKLYGQTGAMQIYRHYLENQAPTPLILTPPEDIVSMQVDDEGHFVCNGGEDSRTLPIWTTNADALCQQQEEQQIGQQPEQQNSDGITGWLQQMFGS